MKLKIWYIVDGYREWATISTSDGWYVATIERCSAEGRKRFRRRSRSVLAALSKYKSLLTSEKVV